LLEGRFKINWKMVRGGFVREFYGENNGCIFVCAREFSKEFWRKDKVTVVIVELESWYIKEKLKSGIDVNLFDLNEYSKARI